MSTWSIGSWVLLLVALLLSTAAVVTATTDPCSYQPYGSLSKHYVCSVTAASSLVVLPVHLTERVTEVSFSGLTQTEIASPPVIGSASRLSLRLSQVHKIGNKTFNGYPWLQLSLTSNNISMINGAFTNLSSLTSLSLSYNQVVSIDGAFGVLPNLKSLSLNNNQIQAINGGAFRGLSNLSQLNLNSNSISTLSGDAFGALDSLTSLELKSNRLSMVDGLFTNLSLLTSLKLSSNELMSIDGAFGVLPNLQCLSLDNNKIQSIDGGTFSGLSNLTKLYLHKNTISTVSADAFAQLKNLTDLFLNNNNLTAFPNEPFEHNAKLRQLSIGQNPIAQPLDRDLFKNLGQLTNLSMNGHSYPYLTPGLFRSLAALGKLALADANMTTSHLDISVNGPCEAATLAEMTVAAVAKDANYIHSLHVMKCSGASVKCYWDKPRKRVSYFCSCPPGLLYNGTACESATPQCDGSKSQPCYPTCLLTNSTYNCTCSDKFDLVDHVCLDDIPGPHLVINSVTENTVVADVRPSQRRHTVTQYCVLFSLPHAIGTPQKICSHGGTKITLHVLPGTAYRIHAFAAYSDGKQSLDSMTQTVVTKQRATTPLRATLLAPTTQPSSMPPTAGSPRHGTATTTPHEIFTSGQTIVVPKDTEMLTTTAPVSATTEPVSSGASTSAFDKSDIIMIAVASSVPVLALLAFLLFRRARAATKTINGSFDRPDSVTSGASGVHGSGSHSRFFGWRNHSPGKENDAGTMTPGLFLPEEEPGTITVLRRGTEQSVVPIEDCRGKDFGSRGSLAPTGKRASIQQHKTLRSNSAFASMPMLSLRPVSQSPTSFTGTEGNRDFSPEEMRHASRLGSVSAYPRRNASNVSETDFEFTSKLSQEAIPSAHRNHQDLGTRKSSSPPAREQAFPNSARPEGTQPAEDSVGIYDALEEGNGTYSSISGSLLKEIRMDASELIDSGKGDSTLIEEDTGLPAGPRSSIADDSAPRDSITALRDAYTGMTEGGRASYSSKASTDTEGLSSRGSLAEGQHADMRRRFSSFGHASTLHEEDHSGAYSALDHSSKLKVHAGLDRTYNSLGLGLTEENGNMTHDDLLRRASSPDHGDVYDDFVPLRARPSCSASVGDIVAELNRVGTAVEALSGQGHLSVEKPDQYDTVSAVSRLSNVSAMSSLSLDVVGQPHLLRTMSLGPSVPESPLEFRDRQAATAAGSNASPGGSKHSDRITANTTRRGTDDVASFVLNTPNWADSVEEEDDMVLNNAYGMSLSTLQRGSLGLAGTDDDAPGAISNTASTSNLVQTPAGFGKPEPVRPWGDAFRSSARRGGKPYTVYPRESPTAENSYAELSPQLPDGRHRELTDHVNSPLGIENRKAMGGRRRAPPAEDRYEFTLPRA